MERDRRIRRDVEFRRTRHQGRCWSSDILVLCALRTGAPVTRFGFVVSKRLGNAVTRNKVKRRLREAARHLAPNLLPGYDVVVIACGPVASRAFAELAGTLGALTRRAHLREPSPVPAAESTPSGGPVRDEPGSEPQ